ncbi:GNAT family N-acetyltransferase [Paucibacter sp. AS339]|uniref:GNAT family N-acetyltransferase n=1 Tax=Paucibacter hankyongi TaxID=3133434 RepID=UPI00309A02CF
MPDAPLFELKNAASVDTAQLHASVSEAFADYLIGPFDVELAQWPQLLARQCIALSLSQVALSAQLTEQQVLAFALAAPRTDLSVWRLASMGAVPAARGSGAAPRLLDDFIARAEAAGMQEVELEVFAQNERALRLYQSRGFKALHELHGYEAEPLGSLAPSTAPLECPTEAEELQLSREQALAWLQQAEREHFRDLPLQVTAAVLATNSQPLQAWQLGSALLVFHHADAATLHIASLIDRDPAQTHALHLLRRLRAQHSTLHCRAHELHRADVGGRAMLEAGFTRSPLHQLLMRRCLRAG